MASLFDTDRYTSSEFFFRHQKLAGKFLGFWIGDDDVSRVQLYFLIFNCFEVQGYGIFQTVYFYSIRNNLVELFDALTPFATQIPTVTRLLFMVYHRKDIKMVLDYLKKAFADVTDHDEKKILGRASRFSYLSLLFLLICGYLTDFFFCIVPACKDIYQRMQPELERQYQLPFKAIFPFEYRYSPVYEIVYLFALYSGHITMLAACSGEGTVFGLCVHLAAQFEVVSNRLEKLIEREIENHESVDKFSIEQNEGIYKRLSEVIHSHNEAIHMCNTLSKTLWQNFLLHFVFSSLTTCIACLMILQSESIDNTILFTCYLCAYIAETFVFCACGNMLIIAGEKVNTAAYNFQWYKCNPKVRKAVLMIMIRAQRDMNVRVPFFELSLETFAWVLRLGGSFITLIKTFL